MSPTGKFLYWDFMRGQRNFFWGGLDGEWWKVGGRWGEGGGGGSD